MSEGSTNWLDVLKAGFWPILALIALLLFSRSLSRFVENAAGSPTSSIEIAGLKVTFDTEAKQVLEKPSPEIQKILLALNSSEVDALLASTSGYFSVCPQGGHNRSENSPNDPRVATKFISLKLMDRSEVRGGKQQCDMEYLVSPTDLAKESRSYLLKLLTGVITISSTK